MLFIILLFTFVYLNVATNNDAHITKEIHPFTLRSQKTGFKFTFAGNGTTFGEKGKVVYHQATKISFQVAMTPSSSTLTIQTIDSKGSILSTLSGGIAACGQPGGDEACGTLAGTIQNGQASFPFTSYTYPATHGQGIDISIVANGFFMQNNEKIDEVFTLTLIDFDLNKARAATVSAALVNHDKNGNFELSQYSFFGLVQ